MAGRRDLGRGALDQVDVETVKSHLRALFDLFGVGDLPQNRKRSELARRAFETGLVREG